MYRRNKNFSSTQIHGQYAIGKFLISLARIYFSRTGPRTKITAFQRVIFDMAHLTRIKHGCLQWLTTFQLTSCTLLKRFWWVELEYSISGRHKQKNLSTGLLIKKKGKKEKKCGILMVSLVSLCRWRPNRKEKKAGVLPGVLHATRAKPEERTQRKCRVQRIFQGLTWGRSRRKRRKVSEPTNTQFQMVQPDEKNIVFQGETTKGKRC